MAVLLCIWLVALTSPGQVMTQSTSVEVSFFPEFPVVEGFTDATCSFSTTTVGQTVSSVTWSHNVTRAVTDSGRISVTTNIAEGRSDLQINNVEFTDAGEYLCTVQFRNPSLQSTHSASLQVASVLEVEADPEQTAIEGEMATLKCNVTAFPSPRVRWIRVRDDELLSSQEDSEDPDFGIYQISTVDQSHAGTYRCTGQYNFGAKSKDIELVVLTIPVITTTAQQEVVVYTDSLHLNCSATGIKDPTYRWLLDGEDVRDSERVDLDSENGDLVIRDLTYDDTGSYTCVAKTGAGMDNLTHTITVSGPPEILLPDKQTELIVADNDVAEIECPFRAHPLPEVRWFKRKQDGGREEINSLAEGFTIFMSNGSLLIANVSQDQASHYDCQLSNEFGSDNRTFFLRVIEVPNRPEGFIVTERGDQSVGLAWQAPSTSPIQPVEEYVLQLSYEERGTIRSSRTIPSNQTSYVAGDLVPGVTYSLVLQSSNLAGLSAPTPPVSHNTSSAPPRLEFFTAESLGDGRSILLQWRLEYSGGHDISEFLIEVQVDGLVEEVLRPDVYSESFLVDDLRPSTEYHFEAIVGSAVGVADPLMSNATTPIATPSKPSQPALHDRSLQILTLSFSVKFGSAPIEYYLLRIYDASDPTYTTDTTNTTLTLDDLSDQLVNITSGDVDYVKGEDGIVEEGEGVVGYDVRLKVKGLQQGKEYVFSVAAGSAVGVSNFSDPSDPFSLEDEVILYLIVGGVVGGVVLVVILLLVTCLVVYLIRRSHRGGKMTITRRGSDSTGVATDYNLKFEPRYPGMTSPNLSQRVDSASPTPHLTSPTPHLTSPTPHLTSPHYYNSLRRYQSDTLPLTGDVTDNGRMNGVNGRTTEAHTSNGGVSGKERDSGIELLDSGRYSRPTSHPPSSTHPSSQPPPFHPPPSHPSSTFPSFLPKSSIPTPSVTQNPTYGYPSSHPLYSVPRKGNSSHRAQVSMSALPTTEEVEHVAVSGSNTLPHGARATGYMQGDQGDVRVEHNSMMVGEAGRKYHSVVLQDKDGLSNTTSTPMINSPYDSETILLPSSKNAGYQTDV